MMPASDTDFVTPDGISPEPGEAGYRGFTPLAFAVLAILLGTGLTGMLGGGPPEQHTRDFQRADLSVQAPATLRNGEFFEMRLEVKADDRIADLVVAIEPALWRNITINSHVPAPTEETFAGGSFRFHHGQLAPGERFAIKFDGQVNPPMFAGTVGDIALFDGDEPIGAMPLRIRVLP